MIETARLGVFPLDKMQEYTQNYIRAGGARSFSEYYVARYDSAQFARSLVDGVVFARHNLASDAAFNEFNVITCRNVMIYFAQTLQEHVHRLFYESLTMFGVLALGEKETIRFSPHETRLRGAGRRRAALQEGSLMYEMIAIGASWEAWTPWAPCSRAPRRTSTSRSSSPSTARPRRAAACSNRCSSDTRAAR